MAREVDISDSARLSPGAWRDDDRSITKPFHQEDPFSVLTNCKTHTRINGRKHGVLSDAGLKKGLPARQAMG